METFAEYSVLRHLIYSSHGLDSSMYCSVIMLENIYCLLSAVNWLKNRFNVSLTYHSEFSMLKKYWANYLLHTCNTPHPTPLSHFVMAPVEWHEGFSHSICIYFVYWYDPLWQWFWTEVPWPPPGFIWSLIKGHMRWFHTKPKYLGALNIHNFLILSNDTVHRTIIYKKLYINNFNSDIRNNALDENVNHTSITNSSHGTMTLALTFCSNQPKKIIFAKQSCYLSSYTYITLYGWHSVNPVAVNGDPSETPLSCAKHLDLQRLIFNHAWISWTFSSVITFILDSFCHKLSMPQSLMHTTVWELVPVGIHEWTSECTTYKFSLMKDVTVKTEVESHTYLTAIVTKLGLKTKRYEQAESSVITIPITQCLLTVWMICHISIWCSDCSQNIHSDHSFVTFPSHSDSY